MGHGPVVIKSADDLASAVEWAGDNPKARWYVARMAQAFKRPQLIPEDWDVAEVKSFREQPIKSEDDLHKSAEVDKALDAFADTVDQLHTGDTTPQDAAAMVASLATLAEQGDYTDEFLEALTAGADVYVDDDYIPADHMDALVAAAKDKGKGDKVRKVRTAAGVKRYKAPIGTPIVKKNGKWVADRSSVRLPDGKSSTDEVDPKTGPRIGENTKPVLTNAAEIEDGDEILDRNGNPQVVTAVTRTADGFSLTVEDEDGVSRRYTVPATARVNVIADDDDDDADLTTADTDADTSADTTTDGPAKSTRAEIADEGVAEQRAKDRKSAEKANSGKAKPRPGNLAEFDAAIDAARAEWKEKSAAAQALPDDDPGKLEARRESVLAKLAVGRAIADRDIEEYESGNITGPEADRRRASWAHQNEIGKETLADIERRIAERGTDDERSRQQASDRNKDGAANRDAAQDDVDADRKARETTTADDAAAKKAESDRTYAELNAEIRAARTKKSIDEANSASPELGERVTNALAEYHAAVDHYDSLAPVGHIQTPERIKAGQAMQRANLERIDALEAVNDALEAQGKLRPTELRARKTEIRSSRKAAKSAAKSFADSLEHAEYQQKQSERLTWDSDSSDRHTTKSPDADATIEYDETTGRYNYTINAKDQRDIGRRNLGGTANTLEEAKIAVSADMYSVGVHPENADNREFDRKQKEDRAKAIEDVKTLTAEIAAIRAEAGEVQKKHRASGAADDSPEGLQVMLEGHNIADRLMDATERLHRAEFAAGKLSPDQLENRIYRVNEQRAGFAKSRANVEAKIAGKTPARDDTPEPAKPDTKPAKPAEPADADPDNTDLDLRDPKKLTNDQLDAEMARVDKEYADWEPRILDQMSTARGRKRALPYEYVALDRRRQALRTEHANRNKEQPRHSGPSRFDADDPEDQKKAAKDRETAAKAAETHADEVAAARKRAQEKRAAARAKADTKRDASTDASRPDDSPRTLYARIDELESAGDAAATPEARAEAIDSLHNEFIGRRVAPGPRDRAQAVIDKLKAQDQAASSSASDRGSVEDIRARIGDKFDESYKDNPSLDRFERSRAAQRDSATFIQSELDSILGPVQATIRDRENLSDDDVISAVEKAVDDLTNLDGAVKKWRGDVRGNGTPTFEVGDTVARERRNAELALESLRNARTTKTTDADKAPEAPATTERADKAARDLEEARIKAAETQARLDAEIARQFPKIEHDRAVANIPLSPTGRGRGMSDAEITRGVEATRRNERAQQELKLAERRAKDAAPQTNHDPDAERSPDTARNSASYPAALEKWATIRPIDFEMEYDAARKADRKAGTENSADAKVARLKFAVLTAVGEDYGMVSNGRIRRNTGKNSLADVRDSKAPKRADSADNPDAPAAPNPTDVATLSKNNRTKLPKVLKDYSDAELQNVYDTADTRERDLKSSRDAAEKKERDHARRIKIAAKAEQEERDAVAGKPIFDEVLAGDLPEQGPFGSEKAEARRQTIAARIDALSPEDQSKVYQAARVEGQKHHEARRGDVPEPDTDWADISTIRDHAGMRVKDREDSREKEIRASRADKDAAAAAEAARKEKEERDERKRQAAIEALPSPAPDQWDRDSLAAVVKLSATERRARLADYTEDELTALRDSLADYKKLFGGRRLSDQSGRERVSRAVNDTLHVGQERARKERNRDIIGNPVDSEGKPLKVIGRDGFGMRTIPKGERYRDEDGNAKISDGTVQVQKHIDEIATYRLGSTGYQQWAVLEQFDDGQVRIVGSHENKDFRVRDWQQLPTRVVDPRELTEGTARGRQKNETESERRFRRGLPPLDASRKEIEVGTDYTVTSGDHEGAKVTALGALADASDLESIPVTLPDGTETYIPASDLRRADAPAPRSTAPDAPEPEQAVPAAPDAVDPNRVQAAREKAQAARAEAAKHRGAETPEAIAAQNAYDQANIEYMRAQMESGDTGRSGPATGDRTRNDQLQEQIHRLENRINGRNSRGTATDTPSDLSTADNPATRLADNSETRDRLRQEIETGGDSDALQPRIDALEEQISRDRADAVQQHTEGAAASRAAKARDRAEKNAQLKDIEARSKALDENATAAEIEQIERELTKFIADNPTPALYKRAFAMRGPIRNSLAEARANDAARDYDARNPATPDATTNAPDVDAEVARTKDAYATARRRAQSFGTDSTPEAIAARNEADRANIEYKRAQLARFDASSNDLPKDGEGNTRADYLRTHIGQIERRIESRNSSDTSTEPTTSTSRTNEKGELLDENGRDRVAAGEAAADALPLPLDENGETIRPNMPAPTLNDFFVRGQNRRYVNNPVAIMGKEAPKGSLKGVKVWLDDDDNVHVDRLPADSPISEERIGQLVKQSLIVKDHEAARAEARKAAILAHPETQRKETTRRAYAVVRDRDNKIREENSNKLREATGGEREEIRVKVRDVLPTDQYVDTIPGTKYRRERPFSVIADPATGGNYANFAFGSQGGGWETKKLDDEITVTRGKNAPGFYAYNDLERDLDDATDQLSEVRAKLDGHNSRGPNANKVLTADEFRELNYREQELRARISHLAQQSELTRRELDLQTKIAERNRANGEPRFNPKRKGFTEDYLRGLDDDELAYELEEARRLRGHESGHTRDSIVSELRDDVVMARDEQDRRRAAANSATPGTAERDDEGHEYDDTFEPAQLREGATAEVEIPQPDQPSQDALTLDVDTAAHDEAERRRAEMREQVAQRRREQDAAGTQDGFDFGLDLAPKDDGGFDFDAEPEPAPKPRTAPDPEPEPEAPKPEAPGQDATLSKDRIAELQTQMAERRKRREEREAAERADEERRAGDRDEQIRKLREILANSTYAEPDATVTDPDGTVFDRKTAADLQPGDRFRLEGVTTIGRRGRRTVTDSDDVIISIDAPDSRGMRSYRTENSVGSITADSDVLIARRDEPSAPETPEAPETTTAPEAPAADAKVFRVGRGYQRWVIASTNENGTVNLVPAPGAAPVNGRARNRHNVDPSKLIDVTGTVDTAAPAAPAGTPRTPSTPVDEAPDFSSRRDKTRKPLSADKAYTLGRGYQQWKVVAVNADGTVNLEPATPTPGTRKRWNVKPSKLAPVDTDTAAAPAAEAPAAAPAPKRAPRRTDTPAQQNKRVEKQAAASTPEQVEKAAEPRPDVTTAPAAPEPAKTDKATTAASKGMSPRVYAILVKSHTARVGELEERVTRGDATDQDRAELTAARKHLEGLRTEYEAGNPIDTNREARVLATSTPVAPAAIPSRDENTADVDVEAPTSTPADSWADEAADTFEATDPVLTPDSPESEWADVDDDTVNGLIFSHIEGGEFDAEDLSALLDERLHRDGNRYQDVIDANPYGTEDRDTLTQRATEAAERGDWLEAARSVEGILQPVEAPAETYTPRPLSELTTLDEVSDEAERAIAAGRDDLLDDIMSRETEIQADIDRAEREAAEAMDVDVPDDLAEQLRNANNGTIRTAITRSNKIIAEWNGDVTSGKAADGESRYTHQDAVEAERMLRAIRKIRGERSSGIRELPEVTDPNSVTPEVLEARRAEADRMEQARLDRVMAAQEAETARVEAASPWRGMSDSELTSAAIKGVISRRPDGDTAHYIAEKLRRAKGDDEVDAANADVLKPDFNDRYIGLDDLDLGIRLGEAVREEDWREALSLIRGRNIGYDNPTLELTARRNRERAAEMAVTPEKRHTSPEVFDGLADEDLTARLTEMSRNADDPDDAFRAMLDQKLKREGISRDFRASRTYEARQFDDLVSDRADAVQEGDWAAASRLDDAIAARRTRHAADKRLYEQLVAIGSSPGHAEEAAFYYHEGSDERRRRNLAVRKIEEEFGIAVPNNNFRENLDRGFMAAAYANLPGGDTYADVVGYVTNRDGDRKGVTEIDLLRGSDDFVRKYGSDELKDYFSTNGRITRESFRKYVMGEAPSPTVPFTY